MSRGSKESKNVAYLDASPSPTFCESFSGNDFTPREGRAASVGEKKPAGAWGGKGVLCKGLCFAVSLLGRKSYCWKTDFILKFGRVFFSFMYSKSHFEALCFSAMLGLALTNKDFSLIEA